MSDYPKYQYSLFVGTKGQVVVRTDDKLEFSKLVQEVNYTFDGDVKPAQTIPASLCPIHNILFDKSGTKKDGTKWYGHVTDIPGKLCFKK